MVHHVCTCMTLKQSHRKVFVLHLRGCHALRNAAHDVGREEPVPCIVQPLQGGPIRGQGIPGAHKHLFTKLQAIQSFLSQKESLIFLRLMETAFVRVAVSRGPFPCAVRSPVVDRGQTRRCKVGQRSSLCCPADRGLAAYVVARTAGQNRLHHQTEVCLRCC